MRVSEEVRELAVAELEAAFPGYPDVEQSTAILEGIVSGHEGSRRAATVLRGLATDAHIGRLSEILPRVGLQLSDDLESVVDELLDFAKRSTSHEAQALEAAMKVSPLLAPGVTERMVEAIVEAFVAGGDRSSGVRAALEPPGPAEGFSETFMGQLDTRLLAELTSQEVDQNVFDAAAYLALRFAFLPDEQQNSFRKLLIGWLDDSPDWGQEVGRVVRDIELTASHRIPIVRALLRAAGKAGSPSWRGEALQEASILAADSKPARDLVSAAVVRMIESGDPANVEAVAIAGLQVGD